MAIVAGEVIQDRIYVEDAFGDPSSLDAASVFSSISVVRPDNSTIVPTVSQVAGVAGVYGVEFPTSLALPGAYTVYATSSQSGQVYTGTFDVDAIGTGAGIVQSGVPAYTMADLRSEVGYDLSDHMALRATDDGDASVFIDSNNLTDSPGAYESTQGVFVAASGAGIIGQRVYVESSDPIARSITFSPALPNITRAGDQLHLFNLGGRGWNLQIYDDMIQDTVEMAFDDYLVEYSEPSGSAYSIEAGVAIEIPSTFVAVYGLSITEDDIEIRRVPAVRVGSGRWGEGYSVDRTIRAMRIEGAWRDLAEGQAFRIYGYAKHSAPAAPADLITIDRTWMALQTKSKIAGRRSTVSHWNNWAVEWGRRADEQRGRIYTPRRPGVEFL